jgi:hypothetical protein
MPSRSTIHPEATQRPCIMQFPETWTSQTRPVDPDAPNKRKRRNKVKAAVPSPTSTTPSAAGGVLMLEDDDDVTPPKRVCLDPALVSPDQSARGHVSLDQRLDNQKAHNKNTAVEHVFKPVGVTVTTDVDTVPLVLDIHSLISRLPYSQMLNQVFTDDANSSVVVPVVTRAYEESYMREVIHAHERSCVCAENCECNFIDPNMPFVGVEFTLGDTSTAIDNTPHMCVLCSRRLTQELFFNMVYNGHRFRGVIQRYGNLCNQPSEYARDVMLICPQNGLMHNMPLPVVAHHRHRYSVFSQNGTRYLRQHKVMYEDFHNPSSSKLSHQL